MPTVEIGEDDLKEGKIDIQAILVKCGFATSRSDARRCVEGGGVSVDKDKITDAFQTFNADDFKEGRVIRKGKKNFKKVIFK
jgi:tyrosyl-tRNA synthetase